MQHNSSPAHFLQLYPVGQYWATAMGTLPACRGMQTLHLPEKWAEVGGAALDALELPLLPDSLPTGRLFLQEGLNRSLPRQSKLALELVLWTNEKAGWEKENGFLI